MVSCPEARWRSLSCISPLQWFSNQCATRIFETCNTWLVRGTDLFSLRLSNEKMTTANTTTTVLCEWINIIPMFLSDQQKVYFLVCCRILVTGLCVPWDENGWKFVIYWIDDLELGVWWLNSTQESTSPAYFIEVIERHQKAGYYKVVLRKHDFASLKPPIKHRTVNPITVYSSTYQDTKQEFQLPQIFNANNYCIRKCLSRHSLGFPHSSHCV